MRKSEAFVVGDALLRRHVKGRADVIGELSGVLLQLHENRQLCRVGLLFQRCVDAGLDAWIEALKQVTVELDEGDEARMRKHLIAPFHLKKGMINLLVVDSIRIILTNLVDSIRINEILLGSYVQIINNK